MIQSPNFVQAVGKMSRSTEQITLDEKIARIRKQNEEIIRRKKIIDEEIESAKLTNAIVNTKKTYDDEVDDEPSLYSDSLVIHQKTTVVYPKIGPDRKQESKQDDMVWRREREEIDNERIRRQKAASGWRREWDANKTFEVQTKPAVEKNQRDSVFQFQGSRSSENDYPDEKRGRPRTDAGQNRGMKVDLNQRLESKRLFCGDGSDSTVGDGGQEPSFKDRNYNVRAVAGAKLHVRSDRGPTGISREKKDVRKTLSGDEENIPGSGSESTNCWRTSGPLNLRKTISINHDNVPNVVLTKVTKYSETQTQTLPKYIPWKNDYSNREYDDDDDNIAVNLSERLKNIVIHVNSDDKKEVQRVVELVPAKKADGTGTEKNATKQTSLQKVTPNVTLLPMNQDVSSAKDFESAVNLNGSTSRQSKKVTFNDVGQSLQSKTCTTQGIVDDNDDDEWEDVSDEDWEDISD